MTKIIKLTEKDIESLVEKIIGEENVNEGLPRRERERQDNNYRKGDFKPYDRESELMDVFGPYKDDVPPNVIQYMRKNPAAIIKRLSSVYGKDKIIQYLG